MAKPYRRIKSSNRVEAQDSHRRFLTKHATSIRAWLQSKGYAGSLHSGGTALEGLIHAVVVFNARQVDHKLPLKGREELKHAARIANYYQMHLYRVAKQTNPAITYYYPTGAAGELQPSKIPPRRETIIDRSRRGRHSQQTAGDGLRYKTPSITQLGPSMLALVRNPDLFYKSREWLDVRYQVLRAAGPNPKCCCCSRTCSAQTGGTHVDHIRPRSKFPHEALSISNLQVLCGECNIGKSNRYEDDWRG